MGDTFTGKCLCGAVRFRAQGAPKVVHCHCPSCRKATGSAFATFADFQKDQVIFSGSKRKRYQSSEGVYRSFCAECGSTLSYEGQDWPDEIHMLVGSFDKPEDFKPQAHVYTCTKLPWIKLNDGLPELEKFSSQEK